MNLLDYFAGLSNYHSWATQRLVDEHLEPLTDDEWRRDSRLFFGSIHRTMNHLLVTDDIWWARFAEGRSLRVPLDAELHAGRAPLLGALRAAVRRWAGWVAALDAARLDGELHYTRNNGETVRLPFAPTLGHVFNHATHHRGQLSAALTAIGRPAPELDWVYLLQAQSRSRPPAPDP